MAQAPFQSQFITSIQNERDDVDRRSSNGSFFGTYPSSSENDESVFGSEAASAGRRPSSFYLGDRQTPMLQAQVDTPQNPVVRLLDPQSLGQGGGADQTDEDYSPQSLVKALKSLERTIAAQSQILNKRLRKEKTHKSMVDTPMTTPSKTSVRGDKVVIYARVVFLKIGEIDTLKENFVADAFIQARWREPLLDGNADLSFEDVEWDKYWNPKVYVENSLGDPKETVWQTLAFNKKAEAMVYEKRRIKGCFLENLELGEFPFDTQDLTLTLTSERSEAELELEEDSSEISSINVQSFVDEQEWKLHTHVETWKRVSMRIYQNSKYKHPAISASCRASRRPGFFIWNIFLVMLFICSLAFTTFTVEFTLPQNRLQISFILLLTTITFKFVVSQTLPRISYLTYLDKYILTSMGILCSVCIWHSIAPLLKYNMPMAIMADRCALIVLGTSYFMFHICFFLYIYFVALKKRWTYMEKDREHKERMKKLQKHHEEQLGQEFTEIVTS